MLIVPLYSLSAHDLGPLAVRSPASLKCLIPKIFVNSKLVISYILNYYKDNRGLCQSAVQLEGNLEKVYKIELSVVKRR